MKKLSWLKKFVFIALVVPSFSVLSANLSGQGMGGPSGQGVNSPAGQHLNGAGPSVNSQAPYGQQSAPFPGYGTPNPQQQQFSQDMIQGQTWGHNGVNPNEVKTNQPTFNQGPTQANPNPFPYMNK